MVLLEALVASSEEFEFGDAQDVELKGLSGSHEIVEFTGERLPPHDNFASCDRQRSDNCPASLGPGKEREL